MIGFFVEERGGRHLLHGAHQHDEEKEIHWHHDDDDDDNEEVAFWTFCGTPKQ